jgi:hypothetical protein
MYGSSRSPLGTSEKGKFIVLLLNLLEKANK